MMVETTLGPLDESLLMKREGVVDNENELTKTVEYCLSGCSGPAHFTGKPDSQSFFCYQHVHRSVHVSLKEGVGVESVLGNLGG